ncbi:5'-deoxynucleotidase [Vibrio owensii]|uniref:5'-deoxynucleotidase n=1 Tax=Vibrio owensii TaxID=696485 RepID=UPI0018F1B6D8|nr:5'-deoxynucleotidase [Vibrio owensii]
MFNHAENSMMAYMLRADCLQRWPLMYGSRETVMEHTFSVALIAHRLAVYGLEMGEDIDPNSVAVKALFHEAAEMGGVGDIPGPLKRATPEMHAAVKALECRAEESMVECISSDFAREYYRDILIQGKVPAREKQVVKFADELQMLLKCCKEVNSGNGEFSTALDEQRSLVDVMARDHKIVALFMENEFPLCISTLDNLQK